MEGKNERQHDKNKLILNIQYDNRYIKNFIKHKGVILNSNLIRILLGYLLKLMGGFQNIDVLLCIIP